MSDAMNHDRGLPSDPAAGKLPSTTVPDDSTNSDQATTAAKVRDGRRLAAAKYGALLLLGGLAMLGAWRVRSDREYWADVWARNSLNPRHVAGCQCDECRGEPATLVQLPRPGAPVFDLSNATVPVREIRSGGPPKDGIPALTDPAFVTAENADYLRPDDRVIGVVVSGEARAYPLAILNYHEIVNDRIGDQPLAVTYCPLCDSAAVFDRKTPLGERTFGVSGLLFNSNVLMYDRGGTTESLWSQVKSAGVSGPAADKSLATLPVELTTWNDWRARYPRTVVLSAKTGHQRDYRRNPYADYFETRRLMFPAQPASDRLPAKAPVLGIWTDRLARAYPLAALGGESRQFQDTIDGKQLTLAFNSEANSLRVVHADEGLSWMYSLWFAWYAFRPQTEVYAP